jgi:hypothetical protein
VQEAHVQQTAPAPGVHVGADVDVIALLRGRRRHAAEAFERSLALNDGGDPWARSHTLCGYGLVRLEDGDTVAAATLEHEALQLMPEVDGRSGTRCAWAHSA